MAVVNFEAMALLLGASVIVAFLLERLKGIAQVQYDALPEGVKRWMWAPGFVISGLLIAATALNAFPIFDAVLPGVGRALTCIAGALGPPAVYDVWDRFIKTGPPS